MDSGPLAPLSNGTLREIQASPILDQDDRFLQVLSGAPFH